jgi:glycogen(starch) synthase
VGVSTEVVRQLRHWLPDRKVHQVANGVDIERYRSAVATDQAKRTLGIAGKHVVGFVGRLSAAKGVSVLLHAATKLRERLTNFCVVIVGDGDYRGDLMRQAQTLGLESEVRFLGERADTPLIYSALDVLVLPSFNEAFPMVILEAMASGTPVVATRVGDVEHIVEDKVTGRLVEPGDAEGLCEAIEDFLLNKHHAASAAEQARARVIGRFSSTAMAESYCSIYRQMLDRNGHTRAPLHGT